MRLRIFLGLSAVLLGASCNAAPDDPQVEVTDAVVQLPVIAGRPGVAYFKLETGNDPTSLASVTSPRIERIELHGTREQNGVSQMAPLQPGETTFSPDAPLVFEQGGKHAMLFGIDPRLKAGDRVTLTFNVPPLAPVTIDADVRAAGGGGHAGH